MKKQLLVASAFALASTGVFAQANNFEGFTAGINVSSVGSSNELKTANGNTNFGQLTVVPGIELGYNFAASKEVVLGLTATYDFVSSDLAKVTDNDPTGGFTAKGQNRYSINFKPGYVITPSTMIYATVGYNSMSQKLSGGDGFSQTNNVTGIGYGLGVAVMATKNVFVKAEVQQINFSKVTFPDGGTGQTNLTVGTIGLGYKF